MPCQVSQAVQEYNEYTQFVIFSEFVVVTASLFGSYLHFVESGRKITTATLFHLLHLLFCFVYSIGHVLEHFVVTICLCSWGQIYNPIYIGSFLAACAIFLRYWKKAVRLPHEKPEYWQLRIVVYTALWLFHFIDFGIALDKRPCNKKNFNVAVDVFPRMMLGALFIDYCLLARVCVLRLKEMNIANQHVSTTPAWLQMQALPFVSIPVSFGVSFVLAINTYVEGTQLWQVFCYLIPSITMLAVMWRRRYLEIDRYDDNDDITWNSNPSVELEWMRSQHGGSSLTKINPNARRSSGMVESVNEHLKKFKPLFARHELKDPLYSTDSSGAGAGHALSSISEASSSSSSPVSSSIESPTKENRNLSTDPIMALIQTNNLQQLSDNNMKSKAKGLVEVGYEVGQWLVVEEELCPPEDALCIVQNFALNCLLPKMEEAFKTHELKCLSLLKAASPNKKINRASSGPVPLSAAATAQPTPSIANTNQSPSSGHKWFTSVSNSMPSSFGKQGSSFFNMSSSSNHGSGNDHTAAASSNSHASTGRGGQANGDLFGGLERQRLYDDLKTKIEDLTGRYADWINLVRSQGQALPKPVHVPRHSRKFSFSSSSFIRGSSVSSVGSSGGAGGSGSNSSLTGKRFSTRRNTLSGVSENEAALTSSVSSPAHDTSSAAISVNSGGGGGGGEPVVKRSSGRGSVKFSDDLNQVREIENQSQSEFEAGDFSDSRPSMGDSYVPVRPFGKEWKGETLRNSSVHHRFLSATGFIANQNDNRFKASVDKKLPILCLIPINCMIHTTLLRKIKGAALEQEHFLCNKGEELSIEDNSESFIITSLTYGAPAAHSLGFRNGGLNDIIAKLNKLKSGKARDRFGSNEEDRSLFPSAAASSGGDASSLSSSASNSFLGEGVMKAFKKSSVEEMYRMRTDKKIIRNPDDALKAFAYEFEATAREGIIVTQALTGVVSVAIDSLRRLINDGLKEEREKFNRDNQASDIDKVSLHGVNSYEHLSQWSGGAANCARQFGKFGMLVHSASLLSTAGNEDDMIDDFSAAYDRLDVNLKIVECTNHGYFSGPSSQALASSGIHGMTSDIFVRVVSVTEGLGTEQQLGSVMVELSVSPKSAYEWLSDLLISGKADLLDEEEMSASRHSNRSHSVSSSPVPHIKLIPVLFNIGVNEMQSVANATFSQSVKKQSEINQKGLSVITDYYDKVKLLLGTSLHWSSLTFDLLKKLETLVQEDAASHGKLVDLLSVSSSLSRLMNGARTTSCKSAKDRTSVFHSLEVAKCAIDRGFISKSKSQELLDELRGSSGVRLRNCQTNTGKMKYAFNKLQMQALPMELRPPAYTAAGGKS